MFKKYFRYLVPILLALEPLQAQNGITGNPDWQIKPVVTGGFIMVHRITIGHLVKGYPTNYELNISKPSLGNKLWQKENNLPDFGLTLQCLDFKNPSELGYALTAAPFLEIPLNEKVKPSRLVLRLSWGATYITKPFDIKTNHRNIAIGSHLNAFVQFRWFWQLQLNKRLRLEPGITFTHASNGKAKSPNLGLNLMSAGLGLNYFIPSKARKEVPAIDSSAKNKSRNELLACAGIGFNQMEIAAPELKCYMFSLAYQRNKRNTHKFSAGIDLFYDQAYQNDFENKLARQPSGADQFRLSAKVGYSYNVGRVSFPIELGYYVFQKVNPDAVIVSRLGVRYYSPSGIVAHFGLRTHYAVAYDFEYGLGYRYYIK